MKQLSVSVISLYFMMLGSVIQGQEPVPDTLNNINLESFADTIGSDALDHDRIDSLHIKIDSILKSSYGIEDQTSKKGEKLSTAVGLKLSNLGLGLELTMAFNEKFSIRFSGSYYQLNTSELDENLNIELSNSQLVGGAYLVGDYHFLKFMHATVGVVYRASKEEGVAKPTEGLTIGGIEIPADIVGQIAYAIEQNSIGYYAGIGLGRTISFKRRVAFSFSLGGYYIPNPPTVKVEASGMLSPTANENTQNQISENTGDQKLHPFVSVQISYRL
jgi:hypothetical protein